MGVVLEIDGVTVEDGSWMRKEDDNINVADLEAVIKGVNLGLKWGIKRIIVVTGCLVFLLCWFTHS